MIARAFPKRELLVLFLFALSLRALAVGVLGARPGLDGAGFLRSARALLDQGPAAIANLPLEHSPVYPVALSVLLLVPVDVGWVVAAIQALLGAMTVVIVARFTLRGTGSLPMARSAGVIAAIQITFVFWTAYLLSETLFLFLLAVAAERTLLLKDSRHLFRDGLVVGVVALISIGVRPTGIAFMVALVVTIAAIGQPGLVQRLGGFLLPTALVVGTALSSAFILQDKQAAALVQRTGDWVRSGVENGLLETQQGRATTGVDLGLARPPIVDMLPPAQRAEFLEAGPLAFAGRHPEFIAQQTARKFWIFWSPITSDFSAAHALISSVYFAIFYALSVVGAVYATRYRVLFVVCVASVFMFTLTSLVTIVDYDQRYRLPAELFMVPLAGIGVVAFSKLSFLRRILGTRGDNLATGRGSPEPADGGRELAGSGELRS